MLAYIPLDCMRQGSNIHQDSTLAELRQLEPAALIVLDQVLGDARSLVTASACGGNAIPSRAS